MNELLSLAASLLQYMLLLSVQLLLILALRKVVAKRYGAVHAYRLWYLPLLWLPLCLVPLPAIDWSGLFQSYQVQVQQLGSVSSKDTAGLFSELGFVPQMPDFSALMSLSDAPLVSQTRPLAQGLLLLWAVVVLMLVYIQACRVLYFRQQLAVLNRGTDGPAQLEGLPVITLQGLNGPALYGILRPALLLPADFYRQYSERQQALVIAHEKVHLQRHDNLWNLLFGLLRIVFWFNPLLHLAWRCFRLDQELSCDELALQDSKPRDGMQYARALLGSLDSQAVDSHQPLLSNWGKFDDIRERTTMIIHHIKHQPRRTAGKVVWLASLLAGAVMTIQLAARVQPVLAAEQAEIQPAVQAAEQKAAQPERQTAAQTAPQPEQAPRPVAEQVLDIMDLRKQGDAAAARSGLDELLQRLSAGELRQQDEELLLKFSAGTALEDKQYPQALDYFAQLLTHDDMDTDERADILRHMGQTYVVMEDYAQALAVMQQLSASSPMQLEFSDHLLMAYTALQQQDFASASGFARQAQLAEPDNTQPYQLLLSIYAGAGQVTELEALAEEILRQFSGSKQRQQQLLMKNARQILAAKHDDAAAAALPLDPNILGLREPKVKPLHVETPVYPKRALARGIEGWVQIRLNVTENGEVAEPQVVASNPPRIFDRSGLEAINQFRFEPHQVDGKSVATDDVYYLFSYMLD